MGQRTVSLVINSGANAWRDTIANRNGIVTFLFIIIAMTGCASFLFSIIEGWKWFDALYFTVIDITTVGFGDLAPATVLGRVLSMAISIFGVVAFGYLIAVLTISLQPSSFSGSGTLDGAEGDNRVSPPKGTANLLRAVADAIEADPDRVQIDDPILVERSHGGALVAVHVVVRAEILPGG